MKCTQKNIMAYMYFILPLDIRHEYHIINPDIHSIDVLVTFRKIHAAVITGLCKGNFRTFSPVLFASKCYSVTMFNIAKTRFGPFKRNVPLIHILWCHCAGF